MPNIKIGDLVKITCPTLSQTNARAIRILRAVPRYPLISNLSPWLLDEIEEIENYRDLAFLVIDTHTSPATHPALITDLTSLVLLYDEKFYVSECWCLRLLEQE